MGMATARAAALAGVPMIASTLSVDPMEEVARQLGGTPGFFQLYTPTDQRLAESVATVLSRRRSHRRTSKMRAAMPSRILNDVFCDRNLQLLRLHQHCLQRSLPPGVPQLLLVRRRCLHQRLLHKSRKQPKEKSTSASQTISFQYRSSVGASGRGFDIHHWRPVEGFNRPDL